jgi:hypothetical protein
MVACGRKQRPSNIAMQSEQATYEQYFVKSGFDRRKHFMFSLE